MSLTKLLFVHLLKLLSDNFFEFVFVFDWEHDPKQHCEPWNSFKAKVFAMSKVLDISTKIIS